MDTLLGGAFKTPRDFTRTDLEHITKPILLKYFHRSMWMIYDRLPEKLHADDEIKSYLPCSEHYNLPHHKSHIDGPAPLRRNCVQCRVKVWGGDES